MTAPTFTDRMRSRMRTEVLDAATEAVAAGGWQSLRMQAIAETVGISRRTLYNEFGSKPQLARALAFRGVERLAEAMAGAVAGAADLPGAWHDLALAVLEHAERDPVITAARGESTSPDFLPLLTGRVRGGDDEIITYATRQVAAAMRTRWAHLPEHRAGVAAHTAVRLVVSHFLQPGASHDAAAREISELLTGYLAAPAASRGATTPGEARR